MREAVAVVDPDDAVALVGLDCAALVGLDFEAR